MITLAAACTDIGGWPAVAMFLGMFAFFAFWIWRLTR